MLTINNTLDGYLKDVEIKGNTVQDPDNLADIRSVGDKVEGQELYKIPVLSCGKNLFDPNIFENEFTENQRIGAHGGPYSSEGYRMLKGLKEIPKFWFNKTLVHNFDGCIAFYSATDDSSLINRCYQATTYTVPQNARYFRFEYQNSKKSEFQLEEGTQATPYEPYIEDKLTILSPTPIEKVGDVRDRIIEKDGVWGVEKNIGQFITKNATYCAVSYSNDTHCRVDLKGVWDFSNNLDGENINSFAICGKSVSNTNKTEMLELGISANYNFMLWIRRDRLESEDLTGINDFLEKNPILVKYRHKNPVFIPLPHDQQIKLRTFANKTNISFGCEIEGTIKAQVPKSLGATVNTHTKQINNLNKELDRVKKLEESTVSTVTTESDFTTVEQTTNGYFEDVKLEGKTLVNLAKKLNSYSHAYVEVINENCLKINQQAAGNVQIGKSIASMNMKPNTKYTVICNVKENTLSDSIQLVHSYADVFGSKNIVEVPKKTTGLICGLFETVEEGNKPITIQVPPNPNEQGYIVLENLMYLEGDHTQNPPAYFEGLKSVGQSATEDGVDEIVVSSVNENLLDGDLLVYGMFNYSNGDVEVSTTTKHIAYPKLIKVEPNTTYYSYGNLKVVTFLDANKKYINWTNKSNKVTTPNNCCYVKIRTFNELDGQLEEYKNNSYFSKQDKYTPHQSDKKRLLYYNEETQAWEKPILREWDSIEKHSDGKYYYHQRSGEVVLNGSEGWTTSTVKENTIQFATNLSSVINSSILICDKFKYNGDGSDTERINYTSSLYLNVLKSKLSTQDVQGFKKWLQANNVTVVYQLAQEKVYECTNIDLITYNRETNYIVESGAIAPKSILKVHNNISNVVSLLQKKVSLLESNMANYMITQNRMQLASTYSADSVTFKVDYALCSEEVEYNEDLYNLILNNILVGKDNYNYDKMFNIILDYASWNQISWEQFDILVGLMDIQHNPPIEEIPNEIM